MQSIRCNLAEAENATLFVWTGKSLRANNRTFNNVNNSRYVTFNGDGSLVDFVPSEWGLALRCWDCTAQC